MHSDASDRGMREGARRRPVDRGGAGADHRALTEGDRMPGQIGMSARMAGADIEITGRCCGVSGAGLRVGVGVAWLASTTR